MAASSSNTLLISRFSAPSSVRVPLPRIEDNLFERLIRDPTAPHRPARERLCTEMLCAVLKNAPALRKVVFGWFAQLTDLPTEELGDLQWRLDTERPIGSMRDDLRIEGWRLSEDEDELEVLWTVEVKVAAPLHESREQILDDQGEVVSDAGRDDAALVSQLVNYDLWLSRQQVKCRAGFVLAVAFQPNTLPDNLTQTWKCMTWTSLAQTIEEALADELLPPRERPLVEHMVGFVRRHLWRESDMANSKLDFDDIALLRAFTSFGIDCERKINDLVAGLEETIREADIIRGEIKLQKTLFRTYIRSVCWGYLLPESTMEAHPHLALMAGIAGSEMTVWIESSPAHNAKSEIHKVMHSAEKSLTEQNPNWVAKSEDDGSWIDLVLSEPLTSLLATDHQQEILVQFVANALRDLKEVGILKKLLKL